MNLMRRWWRDRRRQADPVGSTREEVAASQRVPKLWIEQQVASAKALEGQEIRSWVGVEDAIRSNEDETVFEFEDPLAPCLYLAILEIHVADDIVARVGTYYDNWDAWGLSLEPYEGGLGVSDSPGSRKRQFENLPIGHVTTVKPRFDEIGNLAEIEMHVDGRFVLLVAGEIHQTWTERLDFVRGDESVLVFSSQDDYDSIDWRNPWPPGSRP